MAAQLVTIATAAEPTLDITLPTTRLQAVPDPAPPTLIETAEDADVEARMLRAEALAWLRDIAAH